MVIYLWLYTAYDVIILYYNYSKHPPVWFPASSMYKRICKSGSTGLGKYNATGVVLYFGTGPQAFISVVQHFGKGPGIVITLVYSILPQQQDRFLILISFHGSHTTIANTINLHGELPYRTDNQI